MHDPRTPEILAWLETLPLTVRLTTLHAMSIASRSCGEITNGKPELAGSAMSCGRARESWALF
jgi:hypothetical protein